MGRLGLSCTVFDVKIVRFECLFTNRRAQNDDDHLSMAPPAGAGHRGAARRTERQYVGRAATRRE